VTNTELSPEQILWVVGVKVTAGLGLTVMVKVSAALEQLLALAITLIVEVIAVAPALVAVNAGIFPTPLVGVNPINGLELVHA
jgi:hypothetical protein